MNPADVLTSLGNALGFWSLVQTLRDHRTRIPLAISLQRVTALCLILLGSLLAHLWLTAVLLAVQVLIWLGIAALRQPSPPIPRPESVTP